MIEDENTNLHFLNQINKVFGRRNKRSIQVFKKTAITKYVHDSCYILDISIIIIK